MEVDLVQNNKNCRLVDTRRYQRDRASHPRRERSWKVMENNSEYIYHRIESRITKLQKNYEATKSHGGRKMKDLTDKN